MEVTDELKDYLYKKLVIIASNKKNLLQNI